MFRIPYVEDRVGSSISFSDSPSLTKQAHKGECDVNKIVGGYVKTGTVSHGNPISPSYTDNVEFDFHRSMDLILDAQEQFAALPAKVRKRFSNDPASFLEFMHDEDNLDEARKLGLFPPAPVEPSTESSVPASTPPIDKAE
ncbi:internal scaffolding protein [Microviridae sp.]|nr:internal scaffolding protein [Microviridae sp.]